MIRLVGITKEFEQNTIIPTLDLTIGDGEFVQRFLRKKAVICEKEGKKHEFFVKQSMEPRKMPPETMRKGYNKSIKRMIP